MTDSKRSKALSNLMYCTMEENGSYHLVYQCHVTLIKKAKISSLQIEELQQKMFGINETDFINLAYARKLSLVHNSLIQMIDGKQLRISKEKTSTLLSWFLLI